MSGNGGLNDAIMDAIEFGENVGGENEVDAFKPEYTMEIQNIKSSVGESKNDVVMDYKKARNLLYSLTETCQKALEMCMGMCLDVVHPRSFEVVNQLIITLKDLSKDLVNLQTQYQKALFEIKEAGEDDDETNEDETDIEESLQDVLDGINALEKKAKKLKG